MCSATRKLYLLLCYFVFRIRTLEDSTSKISYQCVTSIKITKLCFILRPKNWPAHQVSKLYCASRCFFKTYQKERFGLFIFNCPKMGDVIHSKYCRKKSQSFHDNRHRQIKQYLKLFFIFFLF